MKQMTIKAARVDANLTQVEIAKILGVTPGTVSRWESGEIDMSAKQFADFCILVNRSRDDIFLRNELCETQR